MIMNVYGKKKVTQVEIAYEVLDTIEQSTVFTDSGCQLWTKAKTPNGYGVIRIADQIVYVHRVAYTVYTAPLQPGYVVDHTCLMRACWNPDHLQAVLWAENARLVWKRRKLGQEW